MDASCWALAIPFARGQERYVVIAPLSGYSTKLRCQGFFEVLESITIEATAASLARSPQIPATRMNPGIMGFALCARVEKRINRGLAKRGWKCERRAKFTEVCRAVSKSPPDVIVVDAEELADRLSAITSIHCVSDNASFSVLLLAGASKVIPFSTPIVDRVLPHESDEEALCCAVKELACVSQDARQGARL